MKKTLILIAVTFFITISFKDYAQVTQGKRPGTTISKKASNKKKSSQNSTSEKAVVAQDPTPTPRTSPQTPTTTTYNPPSRSRRVYSSGTGAYNQGDKILNLGLGLSSYYYGTPIGLSYESGVGPNFSVGVQLDYNSGTYNGNYNGYYGGYNYNYYNYKWGYTAYYVGARGSYHFNRALNIHDDKIDLYAGIGLGYQSFRWKDSSYGYGYGYDYNYDSGIFFNYFVGGKYYFTDKIGAFVELGYTGLSSSRIGLTAKF